MKKFIILNLILFSCFAAAGTTADQNDFEQGEDAGINWALIFNDNSNVSTNLSPESQSLLFSSLNTSH